MATEGGDAPADDAPRASDADVVITTVVSADDLRPGSQPSDDESSEDLAWDWGDGDDVTFPPRQRRAPAPSPPAAEEVAPAAAPPASAPADAAPTAELADVAQRLAALEAVPTTVDNLGKAIRHELERCASVLFGHDRALGALAARIDAAEAAANAAAGLVPDHTRASDEALARVLEQVAGFDQRLMAMETRVEPLEPLPSVVQALRRAVRASDDLIAGETAARAQALAALAGQQTTEAQSRDDALRRLLAQDLDRVTGISAAQAKGLADLAERLADAEAKLLPLASAPEDIAALSRILRRELDAIVSDNQARDQMLRRALQNEIDQLRSISDAREAQAQELVSRIEALETRAIEATTATDGALGATSGRLDILEARAAAVDRISGELDSLTTTVAEELRQLRAGGQSHDQVTGELTRRLSSLDARLARLDAVPGEVQSLRTSMLQESERTVTSLRATDERIGQLAWVPGEFQEARKRIMSLTSGVQTGQDRVRQLEGALVSLNERLEAIRTRLPATIPPGPPG